MCQTKIRKMFNNVRWIFRNASTALIALAVTTISSAPCAWSQQTSPLLPPPPPVVSTVPANGDVNPYGVAFVPLHVSPGLTIQHDDILVTNFNNIENLQGTGRTLMRIGANGQPSLFFEAPASQAGLSAALGVVQHGFVFVGNLPTADGTAATAQPGSLFVLDGNGNVLQDYVNTTYIDGPWGMAIYDQGTNAHVFVSNVLNGTITRFDFVFPQSGAPTIKKVVQVGSGFDHRPDPAALELGPSGLAYDSTHDILYVASSVDNAVYALHGTLKANASLGTGELIYQDLVHLHGPTQMTFSPNGDLLVANSDGSNVDPNQPSELVEFTTSGAFVSEFSVDPNNGGAFGVAIEKLNTLASRIAAVDDNTSTVSTWTEIAH